MSALDEVTHVLDADLVAVEGTLYAIQAKVLDFLNAIEAFRPVSLKFQEDSKTIDNDINMALKDLGMSMMVSLGGGDDKANSVPGIIMLDPLEVIISVFENPTLNRGAGGTGLTCNRAVEIIATSLKMRRVNNSYLSKPRIRLVDESLGQTLAKTVTFRMTATL